MVFYMCPWYMFYARYLLVIISLTLFSIEQAQSNHAKTIEVMTHIDKPSEKYMQIRLAAFFRIQLLVNT